MFKTTAINMLGGTTTAAAHAMGISYQAVDKWPPVLPSRIADRVLGVVARRRFPELAEPQEAASPPGARGRARAASGAASEAERGDVQTGEGGP